MNETWGQYELEVGKAVAYTVGRTRIAVSRESQEWRVGVDHLTDVPAQLLREPLHAEELQDVRLRVVSVADVQVSLLPRMPDKSVVVKARTPLMLMPQQQCEIMVSVPVWWVLRLGGEVLIDEPSEQLSLTWFGEKNAEGELCYAEQSRARIGQDGLSLPPHRVFIRLRLENRSGHALRFERINIPVLYLSIFQSEDGHMWSENLLINWDKDEHASVRIEEQKGHEMQLLSEPRRKEDGRIMTRALSNLFLE